MSEVDALRAARAAGVDAVPVFWLDTAAVSRWDGKPVPEIKFAIADMIPDLCCSLLAGDGGSGKSILLQTAATCIAAGIPFLEHAVARGQRSTSLPKILRTFYTRAKLALTRRSASLGTICDTSTW